MWVAGELKEQVFFVIQSALMASYLMGDGSSDENEKKRNLTSSTQVVAHSSHESSHKPDVFCQRTDPTGNGNLNQQAPGIPDTC